MITQRSCYPSAAGNGVDRPARMPMAETSPSAKNAPEPKKKQEQFQPGKITLSKVKTMFSMDLKTMWSLSLLI